jgi:hypothetical protein
MKAASATAAPILNGDQIAQTMRRVLQILRTCVEAR